MPTSRTLTKKFYRPIEVERMLNIPTSTILYWESMFDDLEPTRLKSGFRRYTPDDIAVIEQLRDLLHNKRLTIEAAKKRMKEIRMPCRKFKCGNHREAIMLLRDLVKLTDDNPKAQSMAEAVLKWLRGNQDARPAAMESDPMQ